MKIKAAKKNQRKRGQTSVEYILIIAVVVGVIMAFGSEFKSRITSVTGQLFSGVGDGIGKLTK